MTYAKKYYHLLIDEYASFEKFFTLSADKRLHVMVALISLSKFIGYYERWQKIRKKYNLRWTKDNDSLSVFENIVNKDGLNEMIQWIRDTIKEFPQYRNIILFNTLTGLRPEEFRLSLSKISSKDKSEFGKYFNKETKLLEHFKFPSIFIRKTKKAFVSVITEEILQISNSSSDTIPTYDAIRKVFQRRGKELNMLYCRKVFATFLRQEGIESEIIDLLQGRIPNSMFVKHYYRPDLTNTFERVREKITKLQVILTS